MIRLIIIKTLLKEATQLGYGPIFPASLNKVEDQNLWALGS